MGCELAPVLPAWGFTENPNSPYQYMGKTYVESVFGISQLKDMGFKVKMTGSVWMQGAMGILPPPDRRHDLAGDTHRQPRQPGPAWTRVSSPE